MAPGTSAVLAHLEGEWDADVRCTIIDGDRWHRARGTGRFTPICNGHFVRFDFAADYDGVAYESTLTLGFDKNTAQYSFVMHDTTGHMPLILTGLMDDRARTIHFTGTGVNPVHLDEDPAAVDWKFKPGGEMEIVMMIANRDRVLRPCTILELQRRA